MSRVLFLAECHPCYFVGSALCLSTEVQDSEINQLLASFDSIKGSENIYL